MNKIIEIKNLKKYFKEVKAVDDISFSVKKGELFAFLGLNGAGKSTTINIICNAISKDSGEVLIDGLSIDDEMSKIKPMLGVVFQNSVLDEKLTVYENLKYRASLYGLSDMEFKDSLKFLSKKLEFEDILNRQICKLSGGQKRRIDIARALIHSPKILILDEPTTGLDPKTRILVWDLISELRTGKELTVLLTTHYMEEASEADYVVIIDSGKVVASNTPVKLKNAYAYDFIKLYEYDEKILEKLKQKKLKFNVLENYIEIQFKNMKSAKEFLIENNALIFDFEVVKGKMDNVFLNVTGKVLKEF